MTQKNFTAQINYPIGADCGAIHLSEHAQTIHVWSHHSRFVALSVRADGVVLAMATGRTQNSALGNLLTGKTKYQWEEGQPVSYFKVNGAVMQITPQVFEGVNENFRRSVARQLGGKPEKMPDVHCDTPAPNGTFFSRCFTPEVLIDLGDGTMWKSAGTIRADDDSVEAGKAALEKATAAAEAAAQEQGCTVWQVECGGKIVADGIVLSAGCES